MGNQISNRKYFLELIKRRSKVRQGNISGESGLIFDQCKTFFEHYEPIRL